MQHKIWKAITYIVLIQSTPMNSSNVGNDPHNSMNGARGDIRRVCAHIWGNSFDLSSLFYKGRIWFQRGRGTTTGCIMSQGLLGQHRCITGNASADGTNPDITMRNDAAIVHEWNQTAFLSGTGKRSWKLFRNLHKARSGATDLWRRGVRILHVCGRQ